MRLWSLHPHYLDARGLSALWREALLAQAVLSGRTRGYRQHLQLVRFRGHPAPMHAIGAYLAAVHAEAAGRGYAFDAGKICARQPVSPIPVTEGQVLYEWTQLLQRLAERSPAVHARWRAIAVPECHPLFRVHAGAVEP